MAFWLTSVDKIVGEFHSTIKKLSDHQEELAAWAEKLRSDAAAKITEAEQHEADQVRASRIIGKLKEIVG